MKGGRVSKIAKMINNKIETQPVKIKSSKVNHPQPRNSKITSQLEECGFDNNFSEDILNSKNSNVHTNLPRSKTNLNINSPIIQSSCSNENDFKEELIFSNNQEITKKIFYEYQKLIEVYKEELIIIKEENKNKYIEEEPQYEEENWINSENIKTLKKSGSVTLNNDFLIVESLPGLEIIQYPIIKDNNDTNVEFKKFSKELKIENLEDFILDIKTNNKKNTVCNFVIENFEHFNIFDNKDKINDKEKSLIKYRDTEIDYNTNTPKRFMLSPQKAENLEIIEISTNSNNLYEVKCIKKSNDECLITQIIADIIIENLYNQYLVENSLNLSKILQKITLNFDLLTNSLFQVPENFYISFSILHEFLEDFYFKIYSECMTSNSIYIKRLENPWEITPLEIEEDILNKIIDDTMDSNILNSLLEFNNSNKSSYLKLDKHNYLISNFIQKYSNNNTDKQDVEFLFSFNNLTYIIEKYVRVGLNKKIEIEFKGIIRNQLKSLLLNCSVNINMGKIINGSRQIYDFKNFYNEMSLIKKYINKNKQNENENSIIIEENNNDFESIDYLSYLLKYKPENSIYSNNNSNSIFGVRILSDLNNKSDYPFGKLFLILLLYYPYLKYIKISNNLLNVTHYGHLTQFIEFSSNLQIIDISNNLLDIFGLRIISESICKSKKIKTLNLENTGIKNSNGCYISEILENTSLSELNISRNEFNGQTLKSFLSILYSTYSSLNILDISTNKLSSLDINNFSLMLTKNTSLSNINISNNSFDCENVNKFIDVIKINRNIKSLKIINIGLNEEFSLNFLRGFNDTAIEEIYLDDNLIGQSAAIIFANCIRSNNEVKRISLKGCNLNSHSLICFTKSIEMNKQLKEVNLEKNEIGDEIVLDLLKAVKDKGIIISLTKEKLTSKGVNILKGEEQFILFSCNQ